MSLMRRGMRRAHGMKIKIVIRYLITQKASTGGRFLC